MRIPILNGIYTDANADYRASYPINFYAVPTDNGVSAGYLRPAEGVETLSAASGVTRGAINWNGVHYRVQGNDLISVTVDGIISVLATISGTGKVSMDYSFDRLAIWADLKLFYWNGTTLTQVTDPDLGSVFDGIWVDGYFMSVDTESAVVTELSDPTAVNPLKYGSSEADPDPIIAIKKIRNEPHIINRYTMEVFDNVGGALFPFQRIEGAQVEKGAISKTAVCVHQENIAFVGSGRNESLGVYAASGGQVLKLSTQEVDKQLKALTESQAESIQVESRIYENHAFLYIHLPDKTLIFDSNASQAAGQPVWGCLQSQAGIYRPRDFVQCYNRWYCGDVNTGNIGELVDNVSTVFGETVDWQFQTVLVQNNGMGAIFHELELLCLPGRAPTGVNPTIYTQYSVDGITWSMPKGKSAGKAGERTKKIAWLQQGYMRTYRIQRFFGNSDAMFAIAALEAKVEGMNV